MGLVRHWGYVICYDGHAAMRAFVDERVRYCADLSDGSGLIAFEGQGIGFDAIGTVFMMEPEPTGYDRPKALRPVGLEHFSIIAPAQLEELHTQRNVLGAALITEAMVLVETLGALVMRPKVWTAAALHAWDRRLINDGWEAPEGAWAHGI